MSRNHRIGTRIARLAAAASFALAPLSAGQAPITYQGRLMEAGAPAAGQFDMSFRLFDAAAGGATLGPAVGPLSVAVSEGLFTATLDFGPGAYADGPGWLEIEVEGTVLSPRQAITGSPHAHSARGLRVDAAGRVETAPGGVTTVVDQSHAVSNGFFVTLGNYTEFVGQSFVPSNPVLKAVDLKLAHPTAAWDAFIRIREGAGTSGQILFQSPNFSAPASANPPPITIPIPSIPVTPGNPYTIEVRATAGVQVFRQNPGTYAGGQGYFNGIPTATDYYFRTHGITRADLTVGRLYIPGINSRDTAAVGWDGNAGGEITIDTSSARFKENISDLAAAFDRLLDARPKTYTRPGRAENFEIGYIAEDFEALGLDQLLFRDDEGKPFSINYPKISMFLVEIVRAQRSDLAALRDEIADLRTDLGAPDPQR